ncbi:MAG TPA: hypothetical protein DCX53_10210 [Anaerolineae bacterium]|nr:hypothetical protein [Anaerolineae bacterium]
MKKAEFERIVEKTFRGLEARHGFKKGETVQSRKSYAVQYTNSTTGVTLHYEPGGEPWLAIADITNEENRSTLGWLLVERGVTKEPVPADAFRSTTLTEKDIASALERENQQLLEYGMEFIKGDFSLMPALQKRAQKYALDCKRFIDMHKPR